MFLQFCAAGIFRDWAALGNLHSVYYTLERSLTVLSENRNIRHAEGKSNYDHLQFP